MKRKRGGRRRKRRKKKRVDMIPLYIFGLDSPLIVFTDVLSCMIAGQYTNALRTNLARPCVSLAPMTAVEPCWGTCCGSRVKAEILGLDCFGWRWSFPLPAGIEGQDRKAVAAAAVAEEPQKEWRDWESNRRQKQMVF